MAVIVFETATQDQANAFNGATDYLVFSNSSANALNTTFAPVASGDAISITSQGKALVFSTTQLNAANGKIGFNDGSNVLLGTNGNDAAIGTAQATNDIIYGFGGNDAINAGDGANYVFGGAGADTITGGIGADHLYGQSPNGGADAGDSIIAGDGNDYVNGNAGNDTIDGGNGSDRLNGGGDDDSIIGGSGNDTINGNLGNDIIDGGADNDFLRGGQGNDSIVGGAGNDQISGDLGDDTVSGGAGADVLTGGAGADVFAFRTAGDAAQDVQIAGSTTTTYYDTIIDYVDGTDKISTAFGAANFVYTGATTAIFTTVSAARVYAQQLLDNDGGTTPPAVASTRTNEVAAVLVGSDTYLFYNDTGTANTTINSYIKVQGIGTSVFDAGDFIA